MPPFPAGITDPDSAGGPVSGRSPPKLLDYSANLLLNFILFNFIIIKGEIMQLIKEQLGRIYHFLIIMIPLFIVNALFNLRYDWGGVSVIARVYIMVLSFYLVFIFAQIEVSDYRADYTARYGWRGRYYLFFVLRLFPFLFIYLLTMIFTFINYLDIPEWPIEPAYKLLDGRYSNTVIYPLILFVILRQKKRPRISIPLFIIFSMLYYAADHVLYSLFEPGYGVIVIKLVKYFIFIFILIYDYSKIRWRLFESILISVVMGSLLYGIVTSFLIVSFYMSPPGSNSLFISGRILLKSGYIFPIDKLEKNLLEDSASKDRDSILLYMEKYGRDTGFTQEQWNYLLLRDKIEKNEYLFRHFNKRNIRLEFEILKKYTESQFLRIPPGTAELPQFTRYLGSYYRDNKKDFYELYESGNNPIKILILKSMAHTDDHDAVHFLINNLTSIDKAHADAAYNSLKIITGKDPAADLKKEKYDIDVVFFFRNYISKMKE